MSRVNVSAAPWHVTSHEGGLLLMGESYGEDGVEQGMPLSLAEARALRDALDAALLEWHDGDPVAAGCWGAVPGPDALVLAGDRAQPTARQLEELADLSRDLARPMAEGTFCHQCGGSVAWEPIRCESCVQAGDVDGAEPPMPFAPKGRP